MSSRARPPKPDAAATTEAIKADLGAILPRSRGRPRKERGPSVEREVELTSDDSVAFWAEQMEIRARACDGAQEERQYNALALLIPKFDAARKEWEAAKMVAADTDNMTDDQIMDYVLTTILPKLTKAQREKLRSAL